MTRLDDSWRTWPLEAKMRLLSKLKSQVSVVQAQDQMEGLARYRFRVIDYMREKLGCEPWNGTEEEPGQVQIVEAYELALRQLHERDQYENGLLRRSELRWWKPGVVIQNRIRAATGHGTGKCVAASEWMTLSDGRRVRAHDLVDQTFGLLTLVDGKPTVVSAQAEWNRVELVQELVTESGRRIVRNSAHPVWRGTGEFEGRKRPKISSLGWTAIGHVQLGDLVAVPEQLPAFGVNCFLSDAEIKLLAYLLGDGFTKTDVRFSQEENSQLAEFKECCGAVGALFHHTGGYDWSVVGARGTGQSRIGSNPVLNLVKQHGLFGCGSREKRVPDAIFKGNRDQIRIFLSRLYSTDGWVSKTAKGWEIGYCSASERLARDVQHLLHRFGVHGRLYYKRKVDAWQLQIWKAWDVTTFCREIGIFGKELNVQKALSWAGQSRAVTEFNWARRQDRPPWRYKDAPSGTRWEKVKRVDFCGIEPTVAIHVPVHHTFIGDLYEHNTWLGAALLSHFIDTCTPSICYSFAPTWPQINDLLWKEVRQQRVEKDLPGQVMETPHLKISANHFAKGKATSDAQGLGSERVQGQHSPYLLFVIDEAEGVPPFVYEAVNAMASGGMVIVLAFGNPRSRLSSFHKMAARVDCKSFRISCFHHPNVKQGRNVVPGAVRREYIESMLPHCQEVDEHQEDEYTFEIPWRPGLIYRPRPIFLWRVMGIAPANYVEDAFISPGRVEAARLRTPLPDLDHFEYARLGIDCARWGSDVGVLYTRHLGAVERTARFEQKDGYDYARKAKAEIMRLVDNGVINIEVRVDGGGGFGGSVVDHLRHDAELIRVFSRPRHYFNVIEVHFGGRPYDPRSFGNKAAEMYFHAGEALRVLHLRNMPEALEQDLCERRFRWAKARDGHDVRFLEKKEMFRDRVKRSPDDGDGFVLAVSPDYVFKEPIDRQQGRMIYEEAMMISRY